MRRIAKKITKKRIFNKKIAIVVVICVALLGLWALVYASAKPYDYDGWQRIRVINMASSQIGNKEWNKRVLEYSENHRENWCADFVSWVYWKAGYAFFTAESPGRSYWRISVVYKKKPGAPNLRDYFIKHKAYRTKESGYVPVLGDVVIFSRNERSHTGIVEKVSNPNSSKNSRTIITIEGNTSTNDVARRVYSVNDPTIDGYGTIINSKPVK